MLSISALRPSCVSWFIDPDLTVGTITSRRFAPDVRFAGQTLLAALIDYRSLC